MSNPYQIHQLTADFNRDVHPMLNYLITEAVNNGREIVSHSIYTNPENTSLCITLITKDKEPQNV